MFAVLHIADFALHAVLRTGPGAAQRPAALFSDTGKKSVALAVNPLARAAGVYPGMTAPQAVARCAPLVIRAPHAGAEAEARAALLAVGFTLSPAIEDTAPGVCTADVHGADRARLEAMAHAAVATLAAQGLPATAGLARTPLLALYAARYVSAFAQAPSETATVTQVQDKTHAAAGSFTLTGFEADPGLGISADPDSNSSASATGKPASRKSKTGRTAEPEAAGVLLVASAREKSFLAPLPLSAADPSPELAEVFHGWGLRTLGDLAALPRDEIVRRFGSEGLALWQRANGGAGRPLHPVALAREFSASMELEHEIETLEPLLFILRRFLERLTFELRASQHVAAEIALTLRLEDDAAHTRQFRLPEPTAEVEILFRALHTHLESVTTAASIVAVQLQLTPARPLVRQQGLFETGLRDPHGFAETLARVSALVGSDRVGTPQLLDTHRPDAFRLVPPATVVPPPAVAPLHAPLGLPLHRFRPALRANLEFTDGRPSFLWTERVRGEIIRQSTAWPSDGEWWQRDRAWHRQEWDIALADGGLYRLIQEGETYSLEGEYD